MIGLERESIFKILKNTMGGTKVLKAEICHFQWQKEGVCSGAGEAASLSRRQHS